MRCANNDDERIAVGKAQDKIAEMFCKAGHCLEFMESKQVTVDVNGEKQCWFLFSFAMHAPNGAFKGKGRIMIDVHGATDGKKILITEQDHAMLAKYDEQAAIRDVKNQLEQDFFVTL